MPVLETQEVDQLNAILIVKVEPSEYASKVKKQLSDLRKKASFKGFRAGKAPISIIRKMYGKNVVLEVVNELVSEAVNDFVENSERIILGNPLPLIDDDVSLDFKVGNKEGYTFKYKLGYEPIFELNGYSSETTIPHYKITLDDATLDKEVLNLRKRNGKETEPTEDIQAKDVLYVMLEELDADGETVKPEGLVEEERAFAVDLMTEALQEKVLTLKMGDSFIANIKDLDTKVAPEKIAEQIFGIDNEVANFGELFKVTIDAVTRIELAEINEELIAKAFPRETETIKNEEDIRRYMRKDIQKYYDQQVDKYFLSRLQMVLFEKNDIQLPEAFLKEWLEATRENKEKRTDWTQFSRGLKWSMLQNKITEIEDIKLGENEVEERAIEEISSYFGGAVDSPLVNSMLDRMMDDQQYVNQIADGVINDKIIIAAKERLTLDIQEVSQEEFNNILREYNKEFAKSMEFEKEEEIESQPQIEAPIAEAEEVTEIEEAINIKEEVETTETNDATDSSSIIEDAVVIEETATTSDHNEIEPNTEQGTQQGIEQGIEQDTKD